MEYKALSIAGTVDPSSAAGHSYAQLEKMQVNSNKYLRIQTLSLFFMIIIIILNVNIAANVIHLWMSTEARISFHNQLPQWKRNTIGDFDLLNKEWTVLN